MSRIIKKHKVRLIIIFLVGALLLPGLFVFLYAKQDISTDSKKKVAKTEAQNEEREIKEYKVKSGDTFSSIMDSFGISTTEANQMLAVSKKVYDFATIKTGQLFKVIFIQDAFAATEYVITDHEIVTIEKNGEDFTVKESEIKYDTNPVIVGATIASSLFVDGSAAGLPDKTIMELADLFGWDVDFTTDIREGDSFKVIYEERLLDGNPVKSGKILAAWFENQGERYWAVLYKDPNGKEKYYDLEGRSVARQFLKSALDYKYVSSKFTNSRINPVTKKLKPHLAVDFAAPTGTPVFTTGDGKISYAGWKGGYGNYIEIKHEGSYITQYAHLSKIAKGIKSGTAVKQGQLIGYVGSTGISTGPHLHFGISKSGTPLNPLKLELPPGKVIDAEWREDFNQKKEVIVKLLQEV